MIMERYGERFLLGNKKSDPGGQGFAEFNLNCWVRMGEKLYEK